MSQSRMLMLKHKHALSIRYTVTIVFCQKHFRMWTKSADETVSSPPPEPMGETKEGISYHMLATDSQLSLTKPTHSLGDKNNSVWKG